MTAPEPADLARKEREYRNLHDEWCLMMMEPPMTKPHDQWDRRDIAPFGRMSMHVTDYAETPKPAKRTPGLVLILAGLIAVLFTLMIAHLVVRSGVAGWW